jgi:hypothetical protein
MHTNEHVLQEEEAEKAEEERSRSGWHKGTHCEKINV